MSIWSPVWRSTMLMPSPPIFQPWVVIRAATVEHSQDVTRMLASLVSTCSLAVRSRLKLFVHSSGEADGRNDRITMQIIKLMSYLLNEFSIFDWRFPIAAFDR